MNSRRNIHNSNIVCPWWLCFIFDNPFRRIVHNADRILKPYVMPGWRLLDVGPGMGYFTIPLAKLVGDSGLVIAADLQKHMLEAISRRALKAGVRNRIKLHQSSPDKIGVTESIDFALAFWMVHEVGDKVRFINEIAAVLKPEGTLLLAEPKFHVSSNVFNNILEIAQAAGLTIVEKPHIFLSNAVLLQKGNNQ